MNAEITKMLEDKGYFNMTVEERVIAHQQCMEGLKSIERLNIDFVGSEEE